MFLGGEVASQRKGGTVEDSAAMLPLTDGWAVDIEPRGSRWLWSVVDETELVAASGLTLTESGAHRAARRWIRERVTQRA